MKQVLRYASFRYLWMGQALSQFAVNSLLFVLALRVYQTTQSNTAVSFLFLSYSVPALLFGLIAGTMVDRLDKKRVIVFADILRGILTLSLMFLSHQVFVVYIVTFLNSCLTQFYVPAEAPLIPSLVPEKHLVSANSLFAFTFYTSVAVGSVMAGPFLRIFGPYYFFILVAALFWSSALLSSRIRVSAEGTIGFAYLVRLHIPYLVGRVWNRLLEGIRYVKRSLGLFDAILLLTGTQIVFAILGSLGPGFADRVLGVDVRDASLLLVGPVVAGIVSGSLWIGTKGYRFDKTKLIQYGITAAGVLLSTIAFCSYLRQVSYFSVFTASFAFQSIIVGLFFLLGIANSLLDVPANSLLQQETQGDMRGRVYGILAAFVGGVGLFPVIIGGALADAVGVVRVIGGLGLVIVAYAWYRVRYMRKGIS